MGKRGPKPKPTALKRLEGNPGLRPLPDNPLTPSGTAEPPDYLCDYAREVWQRIITSMPPNLYAACDTNELAAYCEAAALHREAVLVVRDEGAVIVSEKGGAYQNPWVAIQNRQAQLMATLGTKLGLGPAARANLSAPEPEQKSKFSGLVAVQGGRSA